MKHSFEGHETPSLHYQGLFAGNVLRTGLWTNHSGRTTVTASGYYYVAFHVKHVWVDWVPNLSHAALG